jgi:malate/lactate dehydrogenase
MKVSIIGGAGRLGSSVAFALGSEGIAEEIVMVDINRNLLMSQALDLSLSMTGQKAEVRAGDYDDMSNSEIVIMTATAYPQPAASRLEDLQRNIPTISDAADKISRFCPDAIVIMVTNPIDSLNYAMYLSSTFDREKVLGYNLNDSLRFRMAIARALKIRSIDVGGFAIGEHGGFQSLLFSSVRVKGKSVLIPKETKQQIKLETPNILTTHSSYKTGRPMAWASAAGLSEMVSLIGDDTGKVTSCSVVLKGEYGYDGFSMGVPVILGKNGVREVLEWKLLPDEQEELDRAASSLKSKAEVVRQAVGIQSERK